MCIFAQIKGGRIMFESLKAKIIFNKLLSRPNIDNAYRLTDPTDSWYPTLKKVHDALAEILTHPHEAWNINGCDGARLEAVYYPASNSAKGTVVCIHGYTSHAEREWAFPGLFYLSLGYNVLIPYQRAHGKSGGKYITLGALEKLDMQLWLEKVHTVSPNLPVFVHGLSMGAGIALQLCDTSNSLVRGIIADAPNICGIDSLFRSVAESVDKKNSEKIYEKLCYIFQKRVGKPTSVTSCPQYVVQSKFPILFSAGSKENMEEYFNTIKSICPKPVNIIILPGCDHGNGMYKQTEMYQTALKNFVETYNC